MADIPSEAVLALLPLREVNRLLTSSERVFAKRIASDPTADLLDAYLEAYPNRKAGTPAAKRRIRHDARKLMDRPHIARFIAILGELEADAACVSKEYVVSGLMEVADRCRQAEPVLDHEGSPTGEFRFDAANAIKALTQLGNWLQMWQERKQVDVNITLEQFIAEVSGTIESSPMARLQEKHADALALTVQHEHADQE